MEKVEIVIDTPSGRQELNVRKGLGLQAIAKKYGVPLDFDCRKADCGICIFKVISGEDSLSPPTGREKDFLTAMRADKDERLACQVCVRGDTHIKIEY